MRYPVGTHIDSRKFRWARGQAVPGEEGKGGPWKGQLFLWFSVAGLQASALCICEDSLISGLLGCKSLWVWSWSGWGTRVTHWSGRGGRESQGVPCQNLQVSGIWKGVLLPHLWGGSADTA